MNMQNENRFIRWFFLIMSMWGITMTTSALEEIANTNGITAIENMLESMTVIMISISTLLTLLMFVFAVAGAVNMFRGRKMDDPLDDYDKGDEEKRGIFDV